MRSNKNVRRQKHLRRYIFQKLLLAWHFSYINKKEMDTFGHIMRAEHEHFLYFNNSRI